MRQGSRVCDLCGHLLRHEPPAYVPSAPAARASRREPAAASEVDEVRSRIEPWFYLGLGLVTAPVFALTPILQYMGWFLASLVHEMGHAAVAWLFGMPAIPAISIGGHAAAVHSEQQLALVALVSVGSAVAAWRLLSGPWRWCALALALVVHPVLALTPAKDLIHLLAGHGGELVFATLCLWKALDGGFTESRFERALYGTLGWYLVGKNVFLCWGLATSSGARALYDENGSFGFTNDYLRVAHEAVGCRLETVAVLMLVASVLVVPAALGLWRAGQRGS